VLAFATEQEMPNFIPLPPLDQLQELLELSAESPTGLKWRQNRPGVREDRVAGWWHTGKWGKIRIQGTYYKTHRVVWALLTGEDPGGQVIDHINGKPHDNSVGNLRVVSKSENRYNSRTTTSLSGFRGVTKLKNCTRWVAVIKKDKTKHYLGCFDSPEKAHAVYEQACVDLYGYRPLNKQVTE
jgi:hypothetical protein